MQPDVCNCVSGTNIGGTMRSPHECGLQLTRKLRDIRYAPGRNIDVTVRLWLWNSEGQGEWVLDCVQHWNIAAIETLQPIIKMDEHRSAPGRNIGITVWLWHWNREVRRMSPGLCAALKHCCMSNIATYAALIHKLHLNLRSITAAAAMLQAIQSYKRNIAAGATKLLKQHWCR